MRGRQKCRRHTGRQPLDSALRLRREIGPATCASDIVYFADTDGDGKADVRRALLTGFAEVNPQLRVNTPLYGIDNWIYAAYPKFGGGVRFRQFSKFGEPDIRCGVETKGLDLRFKPDQLKLEAAG
jgi:hypothetical protein